MLTDTELQNAQQQIAALIASTVESGKQSESLAPAAAACGQFLVKDRLQRGLHGTAAALRVLGTRNDPASTALTARLVEYLEKRNALETSGGEPASPELIRRLQRDDQNVIKVSEVLYGLNQITAPTPKARELVDALRTRLSGGTASGVTDGHEGWNYYLDAGGDSTFAPAPLPTAYAVQALAASGWDVSGPIRYLQHIIAAPPNESIELFEQVLCLYVLTFLPSDTTGAPVEGTLREALGRLWTPLEPLLRYDLEANVEYRDGDNVQYIRVPWQLYLLACSARLGELKFFATSVAQRRLEAVVTSVVNKGGYRYPHSGGLVASRTNAIVFELLARIRSARPLRGWMRWLARPYLLLDGARSTSWFAPIVALGAAGILVWSVAVWLTSDTFTTGDLAPNVVASFLILVALRRKRQP
jgi:hypothetical protein